MDSHAVAGSIDVVLNFLAVRFGLVRVVLAVRIGMVRGVHYILHDLCYACS